LQEQIAERETAICEALPVDVDGQRLQQIPGIGPQGAATIRAELGDVMRCGRVDEVVAWAPTPAWIPARARGGLRRAATLFHAWSWCPAPCALSGGLRRRPVQP